MAIWCKLRSIALFLLCFLVCLTGSSSVLAQKVPLALYYETLCPFCSNFIINDLSKIFLNGLIDIVDLRLVPFGNAEIGGSDYQSINCQHGPSECFLNTLEACAIHAWPDLLELQYGNETKSLVPPHEYVPWVVVNNKPLYTDYANFTTYVCKAYNGTVPRVCNETTFQLVASAELDQTPQACLRKRDSVASVAPKPPPIMSHMSLGRRQMKMAISE
ncbi:hypothetical protein Sjap_014206 [Stephania japonica]|uniref:Gamma-interferon-inducible lysosomal thiol reductase n=1 Tax=Stephania japonica TaxID=461633 RepID=A0AAP0IZI5_9MAGN